MFVVRRLAKGWILFLLTLALVLGVAQWNKVGLSTSSATIPPLENPPLPDWIEQISPLGQTEPLAQIRIRFKEPLIPLEDLESPKQQQLLQKFELTPPLPGRFRFLTPRMVGFQADQALQKAFRARVTLKAGLADLKKHRLDKDLTWTFNTEPIQLTNLPGTDGNVGSADDPLDLNPVFNITSNVELDLASLQQRVSLTPEGRSQSIPLKVALQQTETDRLRPAEKFDASQRDWIYVLTPQQPLQKASRYLLKFASGLRPVQGNLSSDADRVSTLFTYAPLRFQGLQLVDPPDASGAYGRFVKGGPQLQFNNGLAAETVSENLQIQPAPRTGTRLVQAHNGDRTLNLNPWAFEPGTRYTITLGANLKDRFGQTLGRAITVQYDAGDVAAAFWVPSGLNIFPAGKNLQLEISSVNLPEASYKAAYQVVKPTDLVYVDSADPNAEGGGLLTKPGEWQTIKLPKSSKNQLQTLTVPIQQKLGTTTGMLAYGMQAKTHLYQADGKQQWHRPTYHGLIQLTNLGVFAQWFPASGLVRVHHLSDGSPVIARVEVYQSKLGAKSRPEPQPCASGTTDSKGTLEFDRGNLQQCIGKASGGFANPPELLTVVYEGQDWAFNRSLDFSGAYGYGIYAGWLGSPESRGTIFSDRQLYQPGEKAYLTAAAYHLEDGILKQDKNTRYAVTLEGPDGKTKDLGTQTTNEFGTFSLELPLAASQPLGYYSVRAQASSGAEISGEFRVAEFKLPNFKVDLGLNQEFALIDQQVTAAAQSNYLFGPPVEGGKIQYYVTRKQVDFIPKGWEQFSFGRKWFWPEEVPTIASDVLQLDRQLDARGQSVQAITVASDLPYPMSYRVDAQVSDVSNLSVSSAKSFTALPSARLIGLTSDFVAEAGKPFLLQVIVTNPTGQAIANQPVRLELQKMTYRSVTQLVEGNRQQRNQVEYQPVANAEVRSGDRPQTVSLTPSEPGTYRIRASFTDAANELSATDVQIWATGSAAVTWGDRYSNNRLELKLDKDSYQLGETATVLLQSPYPQADLYFSVVRHQTLYRTIIPVKGSAPQVQFKVTPDMLPNAAVEAVLVRQGEPLKQVALGSLQHLVSVGFAPFKTSLDRKYLQVETQVLPSLQPGAEQTVQLQLKDTQGKPIPGQLTVMVVNEAVLQLSGYRPPDLVETVYAEQDISTRFADNRPEVILEPFISPLQKGWGYGGGFAPGSGDTRIRKNFQPIAYYNGSLLTDANGRATAQFKLPDDLTTWRVLTVATSGDMRFGKGEATFITTQPLLSNPLLPQFARPGDRLAAGLSLTNATGKAGTLAVKGTVSGSLQWDGNRGSLTAPLPAAGTRAYRFPLLATQPGMGKVQFTAEVGGVTDAFEVPLEVKPLETTEQVVESGVTADQVKIPLNLSNAVVPDVGGLEISLASSLISQMTAPVKQVLAEEQLPFLEPAASQLAIAANLQILSRKYGQTFTDFNPVKQATQALERLQALQRPDDGFAAFPGQENSDPFVSPYAAHSLARAAAAGFKVDGTIVNRLKTYLKTVLANPGQYDFCREQLCKSQLRLEALSALAALGDKRNDFVADIYAQRSQFDPTTQIKLARYLVLLPDWQQEAKALFEQIQQVVSQTGRTAQVNLPQGWGWLNSPTTTQAQALRLFILQRSNPETLDRLLQGLLGLRRNGTWATTYDNAEALTALVEYSQLQPTPPSFTAIAQLPGKQLGTAQFQGYQKPQVELKVPMAELPRGQQDLVLQKSGEGLLHYLTAYRYRPQGDLPGRFNGLRITRTIRPANQAQALQTVGLAPPSQPLAVRAGQVFDIGLEITSDRPVDHVVIIDPLPAGFEAIDSSFQTSTQYFQAQGDSWEIGYQTIHRDRVVAYGDRFPAGVYSLHYLVRSVTPGLFLYPGAEVHLQYAPEEFGRTAASYLRVSD